MANYIPKISWNDYSPGNTYTFPSVPSGDPFGEVHSPDWDVVTANKGNRTVQYNFTEETFTVTYTFLAESDYAALMAFYKAWGNQGKTFRYYPHSDLGTFYNVQLNDGSFAWKPLFTDGAGGQIRELTVVYRTYYV
jgi:hypothetical protein